AADGSGALFLEVNRGKRGLALDVASPEGREVVQRLLAWADVVVANLPPSGLVALGLDEVSVRAVNPTAVLTTVDAFGTSGPYTDRVGFDGVAQSMSGAVHLSGVPGSPTKAYVPWVDFSTAAFAALGTVAALLWRRDHVDQPQHVEASLLRTALTVAGGPLIEQGVLAVDREPIGNRSHIAAPYDICATNDGWIIVQVIGPAQFRRWCDLVGELTWFEDPRFATDTDRVAHADVLTGRLHEWARERSTADALAALDAARIPAGPVLSPQQALDDPHVQTAPLVAPTPYGDVIAPIPVPPFTLAHGGPLPPRPAPAVGEHTDAVLADVGVDANEIAALRAAGIVA
ncbi:MAG: CaiB/BaiF CoA transferase family protein, partial [Acidimicrobiales bacterium]